MTANQAFSLTIFVFAVVFGLMFYASSSNADSGFDVSIKHHGSCDQVPKCGDICRKFKKANAVFEKCKRSKGSKNCPAEQSEAMNLSFQALACEMKHYPERMK